MFTRASLVTLLIARCRQSCSSQVLLMSTLFDHMSPPEVTNLKMGAPGPPTLKKCVSMMESATKHRLEQADSYLSFQYGPALGDDQFKKTLAEFLTAEYRNAVDDSSLVVTAGATQGLYFLVTTFFAAGDVVFTESLTYFLAQKILKDDLRMSLKTVAMDDQGIIPDALEEALKQQMQTTSWQAWHPTERRPFRALLYIMPVFQNPTGVNLSPDRCRRIVELARQYDLCVVCDDVYNLLYFPSYCKSSPLRLSYYDNKNDPDFKGNVISNGSFSKIFGPGVRLGWLEAPPRVVNIVRQSFVTISGGSFNHMTSCLMTSVINLGLLKSHIEETRLDLQEKCVAMCKAFENLSPSLKFTMPQGGYFLWTRLPSSFPMTGTEFSGLCSKEDKVMFFGGEGSSPEGLYTDHIRLSFAHYDKEVIVEAVEKVARRLSTMTTE